ncbi:MAG: enolase C-terminal domain-like protein [Planctomycetaceae bacterium]
MQRREMFHSIAAAGAGLLYANVPSAAAQLGAKAGLPPVKIEDVKVILTQPGGNHFVVVKVLTNEPGLYGLGCATHHERPLLVAEAIEKYIKPQIVGRSCSDIEDIWQQNYVASYFRSGVTLNNALSGIDGALWDILGKRAGLPVYQLLGGKLRAAAPTYSKAQGQTYEEVEEQVRAWIEKGWRHVRCQVSAPGFAAYGVSGAKTSEDVQAARPDGVIPSPAFEPTPYVNRTIKLFEHLRDKLGDDVELVHDVHERVPPAQALALAKAVEPYRLFFLEDPFAPEDVGWFQVLRQQTTTAIAMGELFVNRNEWLPLVANRWIDFIRIHVSAIGGLSLARKIACCCEFFNVRTAWHGPGNVSPVGHAVNLHLDLASYNFGIQEQNDFSQAEQDLFPGMPEVRKGYMYANDKPGLGVDIDEALAAKFPYKTPGSNRGSDRRLDGSVVRP